MHDSLDTRNRDAYMIFRFQNSSILIWNATPTKASTLGNALQIRKLPKYIKSPIQVLPVLKSMDVTAMGILDLWPVKQKDPTGNCDYKPKFQMTLEVAKATMTTTHLANILRDRLNNSIRRF